MMKKIRLRSASRSELGFTGDLLVCHSVDPDLIIENSIRIDNDLSVKNS